MTPYDPRIAVIGLGNILFSDEGLGVYASRYLQLNYAFNPYVELIDGGTLGMNLVAYLASYDRLLLLDTISVAKGAPPGSVYRLDSDVLQGLGSCRGTAHEVEVLQTLELGTLMGEAAEVRVVAMVPEDIETVSISLTKKVSQAMPLLFETALEQLQTWGVEAKPKTPGASLNDVVTGYDQSGCGRDGNTGESIDGV